MNIIPNEPHDVNEPPDWLAEAPIFDVYAAQSEEVYADDVYLDDAAPNPTEADLAYQEAIGFLQFLWEGAPAAYFWRLSDETYTKRDGTTDKRKWTQWLDLDLPLPGAIDPTLRGRLAHVYFGVAPTLRMGDGWQRGSEKGEKWPNFAHIRCFYGDFDAQDFDPSLAAHKAAYKQFIKDGGDPDEWQGMSPEKGKALALAHIRTLPLKPSVIVDSGGGYQPYWLLNLPTSDFKRWKRIERDFVAAIGADGGAKDLARVMRGPGTYNTKPHYDNHKLVRITEQELTRLFTIDQIEEYTQSALPLMANGASCASEGGKKIKKEKSQASSPPPTERATNATEDFERVGQPLGFGGFKGIEYPPDVKPIINALGEIDVGRLRYYDGRISLGLILYHESKGAAWGLNVWKAAIKEGAGHEAYNADRKWAGFHEHEKPLTIRTLLSWATRKPYSWPTFTADTELKLKPGQFVSELIDLDGLAWGETHTIESGTGSGKSYACYKQLPYLIHAVPLVGQVKQFSKKYGSAPVYAGLRLNPAARQHTTTYDGLHKFVKAKSRGVIDLSKFTFVKDECHHEAIDGFKDSETFYTLNEVAALCGRIVQLSGTMPPLMVSDLGNTYKITRDETVKPFSYTETTMPTDTVSRIFDYHRDKDKKKRKPLIWCHLNDKNLGAAYVLDLAKVRPDLKAICLNKQTEVHYDPHHVRITEGDGRIADDVDVVFVTSIFDDAVDIFCNRPVIHVVISFLPPISIEQSGARFRGHLPVHTYIVSTIKRKSIKAVNDDKETPVDTFHMLDMYERELKRLEHHRELIKKMLDYDANGQPLEEVARSIIAEPLLKFYTIKGDIFEIDRVRLIQSLTARWAGYCKREMAALADALKPYGYEYQGEKRLAAFRDVKARKEAILDEKKARKREQNQRVRDAASQIDMLAVAEDLVINAGNHADRKSEEYQAAKTILKLYEAGMTFEAAKAYTETAGSFHKKTLDNEAERVRAAMCYQMLKAGAVPTGPSSRLVSMLFRWLEKKQAAKERISPELWRDACHYATCATNNDLARLRFFNPKRREHANARERGRFLKTLADVKRFGRTERQYEILSVGRFSDDDLRAREIIATKLQNSPDKKLSNKEKERVLSGEKGKKGAQTATQAAFDEWDMSGNPDNVRKHEEDLPTVPERVVSLDYWQAEPIQPEPVSAKPEPEPASFVIEKLLDQEDYKQARAFARKIKDVRERGVWLRRISAIKEEAERKKREKGSSFQ